MTHRPITMASVMDLAIPPGRVLGHARAALATLSPRRWVGVIVHVGPTITSGTTFVALLRVC